MLRKITNSVIASQLFGRSNLDALRLLRRKNAPRNDTTLLILVCFSILLCGCLETTSPPYIDSDVITDKRVLGIWVPEREKDSVYTITLRDANSYNLIMKENNVREEAILKVFKLGNNTFFSYCKAGEKIQDCKDQDIPLYRTFLYKKERHDIFIRGIDRDAFIKLIKEKNLDISYKSEEFDFIVTAPTEKLRDVLLKYADDVFSPQPLKMIQVNTD
jgi:hypothetical protein